MYFMLHKRPHLQLFCPKKISCFHTLLLPKGEIMGVAKEIIKTHLALNQPVNL